MNGQRVTVKEVAQSAGVSIATASRALSGNPQVDPKLAKRVLAASSQLGYSANAVARALRTRRTGTIGVVVPAISNPFFTSAVEALEEVLAESGRSIILCDSRDDPAQEAARVSLLMDHMVEGLVVIPTRSRASADTVEAARVKVPVVQFDRQAASTASDFVGSDNAEGMRLLVDHLVERGARSFAYIGAVRKVSTGRERVTAFTEVMAVRHAAHSELLGGFTLGWGIEATRTLIAENRIPDAIVCGANVVAHGVLHALSEAKIIVPDDVLVGTYDDLPASEFSVPALTSIGQPLMPMAREAIRLLDERNRDSDSPARKSIFAPYLVVRGSTQKP